jgi:hypothetical protein
MIMAILDVIEIFSPVLEEGQTEREIFASIGSRIVKLEVETAFESIGETAGISVGAGLVSIGVVGTAGIGTVPAYIMGAATGGATYLGYKFVGVGVGHYAEKYSYGEFLELYDKYVKNTEENNKHAESAVFLDSSTNEKTTFEQNPQTNRLLNLFYNLSL